MGPLDNGSSSCFDENQKPAWAYRYNNLEVDVRARSIRASPRASPKCHRAKIFCASGRSCLASAWTSKSKAMHILLESVELTLIATTRTPDWPASPME